MTFQWEQYDGAILFSSSLRLHVGEVSKMLGWENLRSIAGGSGGVPTRLATDDWPAEEHEPGNVVFVHGYNMEEDVETPLWAQNVFKKLWWAGLDRGFVAVRARRHRGAACGGERGSILGEWLAARDFSTEARAVLDAARAVYREFYANITHTPWMDWKIETWDVGYYQVRNAMKGLGERVFSRADAADGDIRHPAENLREAHNALRAKLLPQIYSLGFLNPDVEYFI